MAESLVGRLLVATPALTDPNFSRTVVLVCLHDDAGAFGLVLNRPLEGELVWQVLPDLGSSASDPACLFSGGPVEEANGAMLARPRPGEVPDGFTNVFADVGMPAFRQTLGGPPPSFADARVFRGYAGWTRGQLDAEVKEGGWFVVDAEPGDPFTREPETLWQRVLRRQPGTLAIFAFFPIDARAN